MASGRNIKAGKAYVELGIHDKVTAGLRRIQAKMRAFGASIQSIGTKFLAVGAGLATPLIAAAKIYAKTGDELDKMSSRVGASVEFLSKLSHAATLGGTEIKAMEVGIRRLQRTAYDASRGLSTATEAFAELGISVFDANGKLKPTEQLFMDSAAALSKLDNNTKKAALASVIFGRAGTSLLPMLRDGKKGLLAMMAEAERLGLVMSTQDATAAAEFTDQLARVGSMLKMVAVTLGGVFADELKAHWGDVQDAMQAAREWIEANREIIVGLIAAVPKVVALGAAMTALGLIVRAGPLGAFVALAAAIHAIGTSPPDWLLRLMGEETGPIHPAAFTAPDLSGAQALLKEPSLPQPDAADLPSTAERQRTVAEQTILDRITRLRIEAAKRGMERELALEANAFQQRLREAEKLGHDKELLEQEHQLRIQAIRQKFRAADAEAERQRVAAMADKLLQRAHSRIDYKKSLADELARLEIQAGPGTDQEKQAALRDLAKQAELMEALALGIDPAQIHEKYALLAQIADKQHAPDARTFTTGSFSARALSALSGQQTSPAEVATIKTEQHTRALERRSRKGLVFGAA